MSDEKETTESVPERLASPKPTRNSLKDVIDLLKLGDCVILRSDTDSQVYHNCSNAPKDKERWDDIRIVYLELHGHSASLMDEDEWPWYIKDAKCTECTCQLKDKVVDPKKVPSKYVYEFSLKL